MLFQGTRFKSQHPQGSRQPLMTPDPGEPDSLCMHMVHIYTCRQNKHKINKNVKYMVKIIKLGLEIELSMKFLKKNN